MSTGYLHSIQTLGTVDGPGVRFVAFLQGCPLRCACCHNPDTWATKEGTATTPEELVEKALRYRAYWGAEGGVTLSGGEPLLQAAFVREVFSLCQQNGVHTCLDTSGCILTDQVKQALSLTDRVLLDVKYTTEEAYQAYVGYAMAPVMEFLAYLNEQGIPTTLRQVTIPTLNDTPEAVSALQKIAATHPCVDKVELLPFRKICQVKYDQMGLPFPLAHLPEPTGEQMEQLNRLLQPLR
ncbi:MAG: pyruvate formate lyase-activating protein [Ruminococcaceae bacterium]|nr:pyruvate formate lyase-activating protein [Oscillospiraceae bacterium]